MLQNSFDDLWRGLGTGVFFGSVNKFVVIVSIAFYLLGWLFCFHTLKSGIGNF